MADLKQLSVLWDGAIKQWIKLKNLPMKKEYKEFAEEEKKAVVDFLDGKKNLKIINVGCGDGGLLKKIINKSEKCYGMDVSIEALKIARKTLPDSVVLIQHDAIEKWPFRDDFFDCVVCTGVLENVSEPRAVLKETARCLRKEGIGLFGVYNSEFLNENTIKEVYEKYETPAKFKSFDEKTKTVLLDGGIKSHWFTKAELEELFNGSKLKPKIEEKGIGFIITVEKV